MFSFVCDLRIYYLLIGIFFNLMKFLKIKFFFYGQCFFVSWLKNLCLPMSWRFSFVFSPELCHPTWRPLATFSGLMQPLHFTHGFIYHKFKKGLTWWFISDLHGSSLGLPIVWHVGLPGIPSLLLWLYNVASSGVFCIWYGLLTTCWTQNTWHLWWLTTSCPLRESALLMT